MSSPNQYNYFRSWMDKPMREPDTDQLTEEFVEGVRQFMTFVTNQELAMQTGKIFCPCRKCKNRRYLDFFEVTSHLHRRGFTPGYKIWYSHGENDSMVDFASTSGTNEVSDILGEGISEGQENFDYVQMVHDAYHDNAPGFIDSSRDRVEEPNLEARRFFEMLDAAKQPLYSGCSEGLSPLSAAIELMTIKTDYNLSETCVDAFADYMKRYLPEDSNYPSTYYEIQKLVAGLGLPYQVIDVCTNNCMIYWRQDSDRSVCPFCRHPRYQETGGRVKVPFKRMWYLPLTERLKRLYQSHRTGESMTWHADHTCDGNISHPSDAEAWRHFQTVYPDFASERRNIYLGLCTDGFNPFGKHGRQYSLWSVIVTPYNLPPSLCMKREFLFLTILVPGPEHPKRSLDVFLQPLIYELNMLWEHGV